LFLCFSSWYFSKSSPSQKQRFQLGLSVQFYEIEQETTIFIPKNPLRLPLKRNALYPFVVYGSGNQQSASAATAA